MIICTISAFGTVAVAPGEERRELVLGGEVT